MPFSKVSFSQFGEDTIISEYVNKNFFSPNARFIDIGCYHPILWSNTINLYILGWRGINIDANQKLIELQKSFRPEDINICVGIAEKEGIQDFYNIGMQAASTIIPNHRDQQLKRGAQLNSQEKIHCKPIMSVLKEHIVEQDREKYQYLNIDLEGMDEIVVNQIDWKWVPIKLLTAPERTIIPSLYFIKSSIKQCGSSVSAISK